MPVAFRIGRLVLQGGYKRAQRQRMHEKSSLYIIWENRGTY